MFSDADIIHKYTRQQAIEDGMLVDVTDTAREAGFRFSVALTKTVWEDCVAWTAEDEARKPRGTLQDEAGRLWDVLMMAFWAAGRVREEGTNQVLFTVVRVPREGRSTRVQPVNLVLHIGPGDDAEPVLTILHPGQD